MTDQAPCRQAAVKLSDRLAVGLRSLLQSPAIKVQCQVPISSLLAPTFFIFFRLLSFPLCYLGDISNPSTLANSSTKKKKLK
jgi:hypothetical protein